MHEICDRRYLTRCILRPCMQGMKLFATQLYFYTLCRWELQQSPRPTSWYQINQSLNTHTKPSACHVHSVLKAASIAFIYITSTQALEPRSKINLSCSPLWRPLDMPSDIATPPIPSETKVSTIWPLVDVSEETSVSVLLFCAWISPS